MHIPDGQREFRQTPREDHAAWAPPADRADPVATLVAGNAGREEALVPLRLGRMAASPFAFLRGACAVMAGDLAHAPVSGLQVMLDGDAHINNFGLYGTAIKRSAITRRSSKPCGRGALRRWMKEFRIDATNPFVVATVMRTASVIEPSPLRALYMDTALSVLATIEPSY